MLNYQRVIIHQIPRRGSVSAASAPRPHYYESCIIESRPAGSVAWLEKAVGVSDMISRWPGFEWGSATWMWLLYFVSMKLLPVLPLVCKFIFGNSNILRTWLRCSWKMLKGHQVVCMWDWYPMISHLDGDAASCQKAGNEARNLKHEKAETVRNAFEKIYNMPESSVEISCGWDWWDGHLAQVSWYPTWPIPAALLLMAAGPRMHHAMHDLLRDRVVLIFSNFLAIMIYDDLWWSMDMGSIMGSIFWSPVLSTLLFRDATTWAMSLRLCISMRCLLDLAESPQGNPGKS